MTKRQQEIKRTAEELIAKYRGHVHTLRAVGDPLRCTPRDLAILEAYQLKWALKDDGITAGARFYNDVAKYLQSNEEEV